MLLDRRACLRLAASVLPFARPNASPAAGTIAFTSPELQYLEPIYELKLSLDALAAVVTQKERWPALRKRLQRFCGGPLSEQYYYYGYKRRECFHARKGKRSSRDCQRGCGVVFLYCSPAT